VTTFSVEEDSADSGNDDDDEDGSSLTIKLGGHDKS
jgi:hypothetical protein